MNSRQFDFITGRWEAEKGMALASSADRVQKWKEQADAWLSRKPPQFLFTADDLVYAVGTPDDKKNNVIGAWLGGMSKKRRIYFTGRMVKSSRVSRHTGLQRQWST